MYWEEMADLSRVHIVQSPLFYSFLPLPIVSVLGLRTP